MTAACYLEAKWAIMTHDLYMVQPVSLRPCVWWSQSQVGMKRDLVSTQAPSPNQGKRTPQSASG